MRTSCSNLPGRAGRLDRPAGWDALKGVPYAHYGNTAVTFRFGTWPTGICVSSLRVSTSTTDTEFDPAFAT